VIRVASSAQHVNRPASGDGAGCCCDPLQHTPGSAADSSVRAWGSVSGDSAIAMAVCSCLRTAAHVRARIHHYGRARNLIAHHITCMNMQASQMSRISCNPGHDSMLTNAIYK
jgi:hypothetical protein